VKREAIGIRDEGREIAASTQRNRKAESDERRQREQRYRDNRNIHHARSLEPGEHQQREQHDRAERESRHCCLAIADET